MRVTNYDRYRAGKTLTNTELGELYDYCEGAVEALKEMGATFRLARNELSHTASEVKSMLDARGAIKVGKAGKPRLKEDTAGFTLWETSEERWILDASTSRRDGHVTINLDFVKDLKLDTKNDRLEFYIVERPVAE